MINCLLRHRELARNSAILHQLGIRRNGSVCRSYRVLILHRPSNVDHRKTLEDILAAVSSLAVELPVFFPIHPRTRKNVESFGLQRYLASEDSGERTGIVPLDPLGYLDFLCLNDAARIVLTDSGGVQEETTVRGVPCLTLRENTERPATVDQGTNQVVGTNPDCILATARLILRSSARPPRRPPLWDGKAASRIVTIVREHLDRHRHG
jgi:UDP-N-acetylglucosamine 2-epimerase (non-hydrolysing)